MKLITYAANMILVIILFLMQEVAKCAGIGEVIYAVNSGGPAHVDMYGTHYQEDPLTVGIPSDYGKSMPIGRVPPSDAILYQTERYHLSTFGYDIPIKEDGEYVLVLKFCEVWFTSPRMKQDYIDSIDYDHRSLAHCLDDVILRSTSLNLVAKVFDTEWSYGQEFPVKADKRGIFIQIVLNEQHTVVPDLDIYQKVGRGTAHDEYIPFTVSKSKLKVLGEVSTLSGYLRVEFQKGDLDNPKINALVVYKGTMDDVPRLPPFPGLEETDDDDDDDDEKEEDSAPKVTTKAKYKSGPKAVDPYAADETSFLFPVLIAIAIFIPTLFCLCRL